MLLLCFQLPVQGSLPDFGIVLDAHDEHLQVCAFSRNCIRSLCLLTGSGHRLVLRTSHEELVFGYVCVWMGVWGCVAGVYMRMCTPSTVCFNGMVMVCAGRGHKCTCNVPYNNEA